MGAKRTMLLCGDTKESKTTQLGLIALWLYKRFGLKSKLITADGGGSDIFYDMGLIDNGIVDHYDLLSSEFPIATLNRLSKGYWPRKNDMGVWEIKSGPDFRVDFEEEKIGAYLFDSMTGCAELLGAHASRPEANVAFKLGTVSNEDGYQYGTLAEGHYNVVHAQLRAAFEMGFKKLPITFFISTARLNKNEGFNRQSKYFPKTIGKAIDSDIPSWFQDCYHLSTELVSGETISRQLKREVNKEEAFECKVLWFKNHKDKNTGIEYSCGYRMVPMGIRIIEKKYQEGFAVLDLDTGIVNWLEDIEKTNQIVRKKSEEMLGNGTNQNNS